ncbi:MAG: glycosyltransferase family 4 protein [Betaproteobacteria bacterium]|nr:glycosyltransferase family 4 protein [Betaproteobacteria bacterium]
MAFLLVVTAAVISWVACWFIVKYEHLHAHLSHDHVNSGPQKVHGTLTPRIGGISLMAGLLAAGAVLDLLLKQPAERYFDLLLLSSLPAFLGGLTEDVTKRVHVIERLLLTMLSAAIAAWLIGAVLPGIGVPLVDTALRWQPLAIAFTVFAVGGVANATNIIDGFNGLSSGYALIVLLGLCVVAGLNRDTLVFAASLALAGALLGFFEWNWPNGRIFLGDGGAYLLGFLLAELSVLLVERNPAVSPWFPVLLLIYPVFETLFSMYRRHVVRGQSPGEPDGLHLHTLIYRRLVSRCDVNGQPRSRLARNNRVAKYFWGSASITAALACLFWQSTPALIAIAVGYCLCYTIFYRRIVHWKKTIHFLRLKNR